MRLEITVAHTDTEEELRSLQRWLLADDALVRTSPELGSTRPSHDTHMGPVLDVLQLVFDGSLGAANLALAIATWRKSRVEPPAVEVRRGDISVTLRGADEDDVQRIVAFLEQ